MGLESLSAIRIVSPSRRLFALIRDGIVQEIQYINQSEIEHAKNIWDQIVEIKIEDGEVGIGYTYDGEYFYPGKG